jgi:type II secretory pathway pseudopilin PulG
MSLRSQTRRNPSRKDERGYILLTLLLIMALMIIAAAAIVPSITFNIRRDREEEMIHRGVQYSRAIRAYYKKFGRYPTKLEAGLRRGDWGRRDQRRNSGQRSFSVWIAATNARQ